MVVATLLALAAAVLHALWNLVAKRSDDPFTALWGQFFVAGIIGSFVGGTLLNLIFERDLDFSISGLIGSTIGAIIVLAVWGWLRPRFANR